MKIGVIAAFAAGLVTLPIMASAAVPVATSLDTAQVVNFDFTGASPAPPYNVIYVSAVFAAKPTASMQYVIFGGANAADQVYTGPLFVSDFIQVQPSFPDPFLANKWMGGFGFPNSGPYANIADGQFSVAVFQPTSTDASLLGFVAEASTFVGDDVIRTYQTVSFETQSAAPEPATWAMMVGGFGLVGGAMRRRKTAVSFA